jgi:hypothetical protein
MAGERRFASGWQVLPAHATASAEKGLSVNGRRSKVLRRRREVCAAPEHVDGLEWGDE